MNLCGRVVRPALVAALLLVGIFFVNGEAFGHPLGNFSVNHYHGLHLHLTAWTCGPWSTWRRSRRCRRT